MTATEFLKLPEGPPYPQLIDGFVVEDPSPFASHQIVIVNLAALLHDHCRAHDLGRVLVAPMDVRFSELNVLQPDMLFIRKRRAHELIRKWIDGAPDLAVEVLSPSTSRRDFTRKRELYRQHGVLEYWIIDADRRLLTQIDFRPPAPDEESLWKTGQTFSSKLFPGLTILLTTVFEGL